MQEISINTEYIKLDQLLKLSNIASSGANAQIMITQGKVKVNGEIELQKRKKIRQGDIVQTDSEEIKVIFDASR